MATPIPIEPEHELFALAARLAGVQTVDLLRVYMIGDELVALLITGQKYHFSPGTIYDTIQKEIHNTIGGIDSIVHAQLEDDQVPPVEPPAAAAAARKTARRK